MARDRSGRIEVVRLLLAAADETECRTRAERASERCAAGFARGASLCEIASIEEDLEFLIALTAEWPARVAAALENIRGAL